MRILRRFVLGRCHVVVVGGREASERRATVDTPFLPTPTTDDDDDMPRPGLHPLQLAYMKDVREVVLKLEAPPKVVGKNLKRT